MRPGTGAPPSTLDVDALGYHADEGEVRYFSYADDGGRYTTDDTHRPIVESAALPRGAAAPDATRATRARGRPRRALAGRRGGRRVPRPLLPRRRPHLPAARQRGHPLVAARGGSVGDGGPAGAVHPQGQGRARHRRRHPAAAAHEQRRGARPGRRVVRHPRGPGAGRTRALRLHHDRRHRRLRGAGHQHLAPRRHRDRRRGRRPQRAQRDRARARRAQGGARRARGATTTVRRVAHRAAHRGESGAHQPVRAHGRRRRRLRAPRRTASSRRDRPTGPALLVAVVAVAADVVRRPSRVRRASTRVDAVRMARHACPTVRSTSPPTRDGVVVTTSAQSVYALDAGGHVRWRVRGGGSRARPTCARAPPRAGRRHGLGHRAGSRPTARRGGTGRWTSPANSLAVSGDTALVGDDSGTLAALDAATGHCALVGAPPGRALVGRSRRSRAAARSSPRGTSPHRPRCGCSTSTPARSAGRRPPTGSPPRLRSTPVGSCSPSATATAMPGSRPAISPPGEVQWQTPVPASFEEAIEPAVDDHAVAVVDHFGVVTVLDPATGRLRWQRDLADVLVATRVVLTSHRVAFTSYAGRPPRARPSRRPRGAAAGAAPGSAGSPWRPRLLTAGERRAAGPAPPRMGRPAAAAWSERCITDRGRILSPEGPRGPPATLVADPSQPGGSCREVRDHARPHSEVVRGNRSPAGGGTTEEQLAPGPATARGRRRHGRLHERKDAPWQKQRPSSP